MEGCELTQRLFAALFISSSFLLTFVKLWCALCYILFPVLVWKAPTRLAKKEINKYQLPTLNNFFVYISSPLLTFVKTWKVFNIVLFSSLESITRHIDEHVVIFNIHLLLCLYQRGFC